MRLVDCGAYWWAEVNIHIHKYTTQVQSRPASFIHEQFMSLCGHSHARKCIQSRLRFLTTVSGYAHVGPACSRFPAARCKLAALQTIFMAEAHSFNFMTSSKKRARDPDMVPAASEADGAVQAIDGSMLEGGGQILRMSAALVILLASPDPAFVCMAV